MNLSSGSKITAIGGMLACMITDAEPYYVRASGYGEPTITTGAEEAIPLPAYPISFPNQQYLEILRFIEQQEDVSKGDLIRFVDEQDLELLSRYSVKDERNMYKPVTEEIIDPLRDRGFIDVKPLGGKHLLILTDEGKNLLDLFSHMLEE